jgi:uncharacterized protein (UPF0335 family)
MSDSAEQLRSFVKRIERLEDDKRSLAEDIRDVYAEAKGQGYDGKALRAIIRLRKQDTSEREAQEAIIDSYKAALGMIADLPLGQSALERAGLRVSA